MCGVFPDEYSMHLVNGQNHFDNLFSKCYLKISCMCINNFKLIINVQCTEHNAAVKSSVDKQYLPIRHLSYLCFLLKHFTGCINSYTFNKNIVTFVFVFPEKQVPFCVKIIYFLFIKINKKKSITIILSFINNCYLYHHILLHCMNSIDL